jgi:hypothetical protein
MLIPLYLDGPEYQPTTLHFLAWKEKHEGGTHCESPSHGYAELGARRQALTDKSREAAAFSDFINATLPEELRPLVH